MIQNELIKGVNLKNNTNERMWPIVYRSLRITFTLQHAAFNEANFTSLKIILRAYLYEA